MKFTESHEWIKLDSGLIGVTQHAQSELGDIVYIELPEVGSKININDELAVLESTKAAADVYSPVSGKIVAVNEKLEEFPELINRSPEDEGWLVKIKIDEIPETSLLSYTEYKELLSQG